MGFEDEKLRAAFDAFADELLDTMAQYNAKDWQQCAEELSDAIEKLTVCQNMIEGGREDMDVDIRDAMLTAANAFDGLD